MNVLSRITSLLPAALRCALSFQAFIFALSAVAALAAIARNSEHLDGAFILAALGLILVATGILFVSTRVRRDWTFAIFLTLGLLAVRSLLIACAGATEQVGDSRLFSNALRVMVTNGLGDEAIRQMFLCDYDTHVWLTRAFPFFLPLARAFPSDFVTIAQYSNLIASALTNLLAFWLCRRWLPPRTARFAFVLLSLIPLHTWQALEFTHQFQGALFVVCACVALVRILEAAVVSRFAWGAGVVLAISLVLLRAQGGMDLFLLLATGFAGVVLFALRGAAPTFRRLAPVLLVAICVLYVPTARWMTNKTTARFAEFNQNSHPYSFLARGWNLPTWGEFYGPYEMVDRVTPLPQKRDTMLGLVVSQMAYEPAKTLIALPWIKLAKFHLVGFASNAEQQLAASDHKELTSAARGTRLIFAPFFLMLAALGCWRWREHAASRPEAWVVILLPLLFAAVYLVFGETSPRYSFHTNFALALLAGVGLDGLLSRKHITDIRTNALPTLATAAAFTALLGLLALALPPLLRKTASHLFLADMRTAKPSAPASDVGPTIFEQTVRVTSTNPSELAVAEVDIQRPQGHGNLSFFYQVPFIAEGKGTRATSNLRIFINQQMVQEIEEQPTGRDVLICAPLKIAEGTNLHVRVEASIPKPFTQSPEKSFRWGYLRTF